MVEIFSCFCEERRRFVIQIIEKGGERNDDLFNAYIWHHNPLILGHISKGWRDIAWSASELWDTLVISVSLDSDAQEHTRLPLIKEWLGRAVHVPLNICIHISNPNEGTSIYQLSSMYSELFDHAEQWYTALLYIPTWSHRDAYQEWNECFRAIRRRINLGLPQLKSLYIATLKVRDDDSIFFLPLTLSPRNVPKLRRLYTMSAKHSQIILPWGQLTAYTNRFAWDTPANILRQTPRLEECYISLAIPYRPSDFRVHGELIALSRLTQLKILARTTEQFVEAFGNIKLPALLSLDIGMNLVNSEELTSFLHSMFSRSHSFHPLRTLKIGTGMCRCQDLITLFEVLPALEVLHLEFLGNDTNFLPGLNDRFLKMLHPFQQPDGQKALLTELRLLHYIGPLSFSGDIFVDIMENRWIYGGMDEIARLEDVRLVLSSNSSLAMTDTDEYRLNDLRDEGMKVDIFGISRQFEPQRS
ncbi:hypothetical protein BDQ17DRAFT_1346254 [Cyathus striatus]|nr:hypothetical protein BDQ17DRAFT_1346254 [Cyathus striatus]